MRAGMLVVGAALVAAGCEKPPRDRIEKSETTITDRGERPQYMLRYEIPEGFEQSVDTVMDIEMEMSGAQELEVSMPRVILTERLKIEKVDGKGGMHLVAESSDVQTLDDGTSDDRVVEAAREAMEELDGMVMTATLNPDGGMRALRLDLSSMSAGAREQAQQLEQALDQMIAKLPEVSVGKGATWTTEQTVRMSGMKLFYTWEYEVLEISADGATLHVDVEVTAPPQQVVTPKGAFHLNAMIGEGTIDMELDLHAVTSRVTAEMDMEMAMSAGGRAVDFDMKMAFQVLPTGEVPEPRARKPPPTGQDTYESYDYNPNVIISH